MQIRNGHLWTIYYFLTIIFSGFDLRIGNKRRICCGPLNRRRKKSMIQSINICYMNMNVVYVSTRIYMYQVYCTYVFIFDSV